jgi:hypothetical protein
LLNKRHVRPELLEHVVLAILLALQLVFVVLRFLVSSIIFLLIVVVVTQRMILVVAAHLVKLVQVGAV